MAVNAPPLTGNVDPRGSWWAVPAVLAGAGAICGADRLASTLPWRRLLWASFAAALTWSVALALWDGAAGLTRSPASSVDYLQALPVVGDLGAFLGALIEGTASLPAHVRAHPPGMLVLLLGMRRIGIATPLWLGLVEQTAAASSVPAVLLSVRAVADERLARRAAPFLAFSPISLTWSSGDAVFLGVGAWAVAFAVLAIDRHGRESDSLAVGAGALWSAAVFLTYGIVLLALVPAAIAWRRRRARPIAIAAAIVVTAGIMAAAGGFSWLEGLSATRGAYAHSVARVRPYHFFLVANLAAAAIAVGPATWAGLARLRDRRLWLLASGALVAVLLANLSGLSKAEVERIWLPFLPWLVVAGAGAFAGATRTARRGWLGLQLAWALSVQMAVLSPW
jgi:hypothetical protein